jgi:hypothetical protein
LTSPESAENELASGGGTFWKKTSADVRGDGRKEERERADGKKRVNANEYKRAKPTEGSKKARPLVFEEAGPIVPK